MIETLHTPNLWSRVAEERKSTRGFVVAAVAYANHDHLKLTAGDTLICDASDQRVASGATTHKLLKTLSNRGVKLFHYPNLHAKVVRLPHCVVVGSANMTKNAMSLMEVAVLTDEKDALKQADEILSKLKRRCANDEIDSTFLSRIATIEVRASDGRATDMRNQRTHCTWLMGYIVLSEREQRRSNALIESASPTVPAPDYFRATKLAAEKKAPIQRGDTLIFVHRGEGVVRRPVKVTGVVEAKRFLFYIHEPVSPGGVAWHRVQERLEHAGVPTKGVPSQRALDEHADAVVRSMFRRTKPHV